MLDLNIFPTAHSKYITTISNISIKSIIKAPYGKVYTCEQNQPAVEILATDVSSAPAAGGFQQKEGCSSTPGEIRAQLRGGIRDNILDEKLQEDNLKGNF